MRQDNKGGSWGGGEASSPPLDETLAPIFGEMYNQFSISCVDCRCLSADDLPQDYNDKYKNLSVP